MSTKFFIFLGMTVGSIAGGYLPMLWGDSFLSFASVLTSGVGGLAGVWVGYKISQLLY